MPLGTLQQTLETSLVALNQTFAIQLDYAFKRAAVPLQTQTRRLQDTYGNGLRPDPDAVQAAVEAFARSQIAPQDRYRYDLVGLGLNLHCTALAGRTLVEEPDLCAAILARYRAELLADTLWDVSWRGVFQGYFAIPATVAPDRRDVLRTFLQETWPRLQSTTGSYRWAQVLSENQALLDPEPCRSYAAEWLVGSEDRIMAIAASLDIPDASWFWQEVFAAVLQHAVALDDAAFHASIDRLLKLLADRPTALSYGLTAILNRYHKCQQRPLHKALKDFCLQHWKSPQLRDSGGSPWQLVEAPVAQMVLSWINEADLRLFFDKLAARNGADKGRLKFWLNYIDQVAWTRLVFGYRTRTLGRSDPDLKQLLAAGNGAWLDSADQELDAFIMKVGNYIIVEFSRDGNGCYIYRDGAAFHEGGHRFSLTAPRYSTETAPSGLKERYSLTRTPDIVHRPGWPDVAQVKLMTQFGIFPDALPHNNNTAAPGPQTSADFRSQARALALQHGAGTEDFVAHGGAFWVNYDRPHGTLAATLQALRFRYKEGRGWWRI